MKISAASLLLAFAGFLQESKCMFVQPGERPSLETGYIELTLENGKTVEGALEMDGRKPSRLRNEPVEDSQTYGVLFHAAMIGDYQARLPYSPHEPGSHVPKSVRIRIGSFMYLSYGGFKEYKEGENKWLKNGIDHIYITMPGTNKIYVELLETDASFKRRMETELKVREEIERRKKLAENRAGQSSTTAGPGH